MKRSGFSMIELVFVIVILGVLAAVAIPRFVATRTDAQIATARSDLSTIQKQIVAKVFADNIDTTANKAPDPNKKVAEQAGTGFTMGWADWILTISGVSRDKFKLGTGGGGDAANKNKLNGVTFTDMSEDGTRYIEAVGNVSGSDIAGKGSCGGILGIAPGNAGSNVISGNMMFDPTHLSGALLNGNKSVGTERDGSFCKGLSASYRTSGDWGNRIVPLATSGTIEW